MKKFQKMFLGLIIVILGVLWGLHLNKVINIGNIFFDGWWALFIIVPCTINLFTSKEKFSNLIGIGVGVLAILIAQDILSLSVLWNWFFPGIIVVIGLKIFVYGFKKNTASEVMKKKADSGIKISKFNAIFSEEKPEIKSDVFEAADLNAVFGSLKIDLRNSQIKEGSVISAFAMLGEIEILLPEDVNVKTDSSSVFGSVTEKKHRETDDNEKTIYIDAKTFMGGVNIN
ncbi:MAG: LiaF-related protein [Clostridia bacterium]|nr:LiaF-related protein [Clostridia bacterium]